MADIDNIKSKLDIVEIVSQYVPNLARSGVNFKANCPFHSEKSPSFMVNPSLRIYKCFGCGKGGDVISFIQEVERLDFREALELCAEKAGVELEHSFNSKESRNNEEKKKIIEANNSAAQFYNYILLSHKTGKKGRSYAQKRGIDIERIKLFCMGYAPASKQNLKNFLLKKGFLEKDLVSWGLLVERHEGKKIITIDKFRDRLIHPIYNSKGDVVGFSGRYIGDSLYDPKYLNSPETLVYKKNETLYGFYQGRDSIRKLRSVIIQEGNIDILSSHKAGIENIVAPLGTAFTENQAKILKRFVDEFLFCFDTDSAGLRALIKSVEIAENLGVSHKVININPFKDPDELIASDISEWQKRVKGAVNTYDYLIAELGREMDLNSVEGKVLFNNRIIPILSLIKDKITLNHFIKKVSIILEITEQDLMNRVKSKYIVPLVRKEESKNESEVLLGDHSVEFKQELYLLSLVVSNNTIKTLDLEDECITNYSLRSIYKKLKNSQDNDPAAIYDIVNDSEKEFLESILMFDIGNIEDVEKEIYKMTKVIKTRFIKSQIMKLRKDISIEESADKVQKLQDLISKLSLISR